MEEFFKKITDTFKGFLLTERERTAMRLNLAAFIDEHPATAPRMVRASGAASSVVASVFSWFRMHHGFRTVSAALALFLVAGAGTSYAAADALPGNPLYTLKLNLDEPIERATVASDQSQTQWDLTLANRRLQEAEKLAASGTLTPQNADIVVTQINAATQNFNASVATLATSTATSTNAVTAAVQVADAQSDLEAALSAHVQVLSDIASSSEAVGSQIAPVLAVVRAHASVAQAARIAALSGLDDDATSTIKVAASGEMAAAISQLKILRGLASSTAPAEAASSTQVEIDASSTQAAIAAGSKNLEKGRYREAFEAFQSAVQSATEAQVSAQAQANLGSSIIIAPVGPANDASSTSPVDNATSSATTSAQSMATSSNATDSAAGDLNAALGN